MGTNSRLWLLGLAPVLHVLVVGLGLLLGCWVLSSSCCQAIAASAACIVPLLLPLAGVDCLTRVLRCWVVCLGFAAAPAGAAWPLGSLQVSSDTGGNMGTVKPPGTTGGSIGRDKNPACCCCWGCGCRCGCGCCCGCLLSAAAAHATGGNMGSEGPAQLLLFVLLPVLPVLVLVLLALVLVASAAAAFRETGRSMVQAGGGPHTPARPTGLCQPQRTMPSAKPRPQGLKQRKTALDLGLAVAGKPC